ncbi:MAG TPA: deoxyribonuclease IV [Terriglobia bacterium]|nr:deoxyribonuclease IV [Terriglobia bacterium]
MRVGVHTSIAGGVANAAHHAQKIGCDTFQMFSANPRGWRGRERPQGEYDAFREARSLYKLDPVVVHTNYLVNLASADARIGDGSISVFRRELERALALGADFLVTHPGSAKGTTKSQAIARCVESLRSAAAGLHLDGLMVLIENTAGQGSAIGSTFEEVAEIITGTGRDFPVGACIDTAHCFAAGYPVHTPVGLKTTVRHIENSLGIENVRVIHANDSKTLFESRTDRHEHIGKGHIGAEAFSRIVRHPKLKRIPFICETPIDRPGDDKRNIWMLRRLAAKDNEE